MKKIKKLFFAAGFMLLAAGLLAGCGKGKNAGTEEKVIHISAAPEPTVTPAPETTNPDAVTQNGNLTMVNEYLVNNPDAAPGSGTGNSDAAADSSDSAAETESQDTGGGSVDEESAGDVSQDQEESQDGE